MKFIFVLLLLTIILKPISCHVSEARLAYIYYHPKTSDILKRPIEQYIFFKRMNKCLKIFGSRLICESKSIWFMWAQLLAEDILNGKEF